MEIDKRVNENRLLSEKKKAEAALRFPDAEIKKVKSPHPIIKVDKSPKLNDIPHSPMFEINN